MTRYWKRIIILKKIIESTVKVGKVKKKERDEERKEGKKRGRKKEIKKNKKPQPTLQQSFAQKVDL